MIFKIFVGGMLYITGDVSWQSWFRFYLLIPWYRGSRPRLKTWKLDATAPRHVQKVEWRFGGKNRWMEDIPRIFPFGEAEYLGSRCWFEMFF